MRGLTVKVGVDSVLEVRAGSKVDELELVGLEVDQQVLVLDVPVDDPGRVARDDRLDDLAEEVAREPLLEHALLSDEVKEVLAGRGLLHHVDEGVVELVVVEESDDSGDALDLGEELQLQRDTPFPDLEERTSCKLEIKSTEAHV